MNLDNIQTSRDVAAVLVAWLESRGATFMLRDDDTFHCDLDSARLRDQEHRDGLAKGVLALREEIRWVLQSRQVVH
jgi:hypothetical protein